MHVAALCWRRQRFCVPVTTSQRLHLSADLRDRPLCSIHVASCPSLKLKWAQSNAISTCLPVYLSALLPSSWYSSLNLGSPQTTHHHYVWLWRRDESRWPCLWFWGSSSSRLRGAAWGSAAWDCWYWAARSAPGTIHQKGAVCTVGIDMNNPCFLCPFLCNYAYPITFCVAFSSNTQPSYLYKTFFNLISILKKIDVLSLWNL